MRISDWSSDVCSSDLAQGLNPPGPDTIWQASGDKLTPATPVTLSAANDRGQRFQIRIAVDQDFMFTVQQTVANAGTAPVQVATYALVNRKGVSVDPDSRSEEHTSELQSLMRISYAVFCLKKKKQSDTIH